MATAAKTPKDKPHTAPRLAPRPTAASAARAARNATNRNLTLQLAQKQSPTRIPPHSPPPKGGKTNRIHKLDSKSDVKVHKIIENQVTESDVFIISNKRDSEICIIENPSCVTVDKTDNSNDLSEINEQEPETEGRSRNEPRVEEMTIMEEDATVEKLPEIAAKPRCRTPSLSSRPQTPKNIQSSRPQTPRIPSRPTTPARHSGSISRPTTPRQNTPQSRPKSPNPVPTTQTTNIAQIKIKHLKEEDEDIKAQFVSKQKEFLRMKKELDMKQQAILELFNGLRLLTEQIPNNSDSGSGEGLPLQELVIFNVGDWTSEEVAQLCRDAVASSATQGAADVIATTEPIDECALAELDASMTNVPRHFADLCLQAFTDRQELIDWVKDLIGRNEEGAGESLERIAQYNAQGFELCEALRQLKTRADIAIDTISQLSRRACHERATLISVGEQLVREIAYLRHDLEAKSVPVNEINEMRAVTETSKALEELRHELEEERTAKAAMKEKLAIAESQLRQTRGRVTKMDRQLREAEASIASLTGTVKSLEDQSRQREVQLEARARKLKESLKTGEVASTHIAQQRDNLQNEVQSLKEQIEAMTAQHKASIQELNNQIKNLKTSLEEHKQITEREINLRQSTEARLEESENIIEELKAKCTELENSRPNPELPTEREMDLWAELQATKDILRTTEDEVTASKREKVRFLETLTKIAESENKLGMQQKLAAELLSKEEIISKMQIQIRELSKNIKLNEQKVIQYEQYVRDLQAHNRAVANCQEAPNGISYQDLQQEIMDLRMGLLEAVHRNEELSEILAQKEQQLEQQDKTSRAQARVIKVREELINMLKNKETEQSRELATLQQDLEHRMKVVDEVNKQIAAKAEEIQELFTTLESKQQQIHRLEKIVLALEEQQRRAQAQRTRHEEKIAALEHELAAGNRRERKFIFF